MNVLGLDTCFGACSAAVGIGLGTPAEKRFARIEPMATGHAERLIPMVETVLAEAGLDLGGIDRIAVTTGPGTFTGTRISVAAARALRLATGKPIVAFSSLEVLAHHAALTDIAPDHDLLIAVDAHRGEAYAQLFDGASRDPIGPPRAVALSQPYDGAQRPLVIAGSAAVVLARHHPGARAVDGVALPSIADILHVAARRPVTTGTVIPLYLRPPDAKPQDDKSLARAMP